MQWEILTAISAAAALTCCLEKIVLMYQINLVSWNTSHPSWMPKMWLRVYLLCILLVVLGTEKTFSEDVSLTHGLTHVLMSLDHPMCWICFLYQRYYLWPSLHFAVITLKHKSFSHDLCFGIKALERPQHFSNIVTKSSQKRDHNYRWEVAEQ